MRRRDRSSHLGTESRLADGRGLPLPHLYRQPSGERRWPGCLPHRVCRFPLLSYPPLAGRHDLSIPQSTAAPDRNLLAAISQIERRRLRRGLEIAVVVASVLEFVALFQIVVPITPPNRLHAAGLDAKNEVFADSVGWADISNQVTTIYGDLPPSEQENTVIISAYVGVPGAVQIYGNPDLRPKVVSPHLSDFYWLPSHLTATDALMVDYQPSEVAWMCTSPRIIAHLTVPYDVAGLEQGAPVTFCQLKAPIPKIWGQHRNFS
jgi:hypothetical protein